MFWASGQARASVNSNVYLTQGSHCTQVQRDLGKIWPTVDIPLFPLTKVQVTGGLVDDEQVPGIFKLFHQHSTQGGTPYEIRCITFEFRDWITRLVHETTRRQLWLGWWAALREGTQWRSSIIVQCILKAVDQAVRNRIRDKGFFRLYERTWMEFLWGQWKEGQDILPVGRTAGNRTSLYWREPREDQVEITGPAGLTYPASIQGNERQRSRAKAQLIVHWGQWCGSSQGTWSTAGVGEPERGYWMGTRRPGPGIERLWEEMVEHWSMVDWHMGPEEIPV